MRKAAEDPCVAATTSMIAFAMPSYGELMVLAVIGLLIFGRRLPEVGRTVGKTLTQFRRGMQEFKAQMDADDSLREVKSTMHDIRKVSEAPRVLANPQQWLDNLTDENMASPGPGTQVPAQAPAATSDTESPEPPTPFQPAPTEKPADAD